MVGSQVENESRCLSVRWPFLVSSVGQVVVRVPAGRRSVRVALSWSVSSVVISSVWWSCVVVLGVVSVGQVVVRVLSLRGDSAEGSSWPGVAPGGGASGLVGRQSW
jgi:uncharacterized membrane protein AbrB (regulator of aidB expression)